MWRRCVCCVARVSGRVRRVCRRVWRSLLPPLGLRRLLRSVRVVRLVRLCAFLRPMRKVLAPVCVAPFAFCALSPIGGRVGAPAVRALSLLAPVFALRPRWARVLAPVRRVRVLRARLRRVVGAALDSNPSALLRIRYVRGLSCAR